MFFGSVECTVPRRVMAKYRRICARAERRSRHEALETHYQQHPEARPSLVEVALALAAQDGSPLAERPDLIERAAAQVTSRHPDADADDVLLWAEAQRAAPA